MASSRAVTPLPRRLIPLGKSKSCTLFVLSKLIDIQTQIMFHLGTRQVFPQNTTHLLKQVKLRLVLVVTFTPSANNNSTTFVAPPAVA